MSFKVIQIRRDGSISFHDKLWTEYETGFGSISNEFWLGMDKIIVCEKFRLNLELIDTIQTDRNKILHYLLIKILNSLAVTRWQSHF